MQSKHAAEWPPVLPLSCQPVPVAGGNISFWGWNWHCFVHILFWDHVCRLCTVISRTRYPSVDFSVGELLAELTQKVCATHGCTRGWVPLTFGEGLCQNPKASPAPLETVVLVLSVKRLLFSFFIFSLSLSLTAESINNCSAEFLEAFLPLPHFLKSLHTEWDTHKLFRDKNLIYLRFIVPGMATDWFGNLLFQL